MVELASEEDKAAYQALALFIKTYQLFYTSMKLGDIPYSEALQGEEGNVKPQYDPQEDVMIAIMNDLDESARFSMKHKISKAIRSSKVIFQNGKRQ